MPIDKSKLPLIMAYRKVLSEIDHSILMLKQQNPNLLTLEEVKIVEETYRNKREEFLELSNRLQENNNKLNTLASNTTSVQTEKEHLLNELQEQRKKYEGLQKDLEQLAKRVEESFSDEAQKYREKLIDREIVKKKLSELETTLDEETLEQAANLQATEKKSSPFGPVLINKNLLETIIKSSDWQKEFSNKHKLYVIEDRTEGIIQFISQEKDIQIEVSKEKISGQWSKEKESSAISIMVELYLKGIENQKVDKHKVESKDPESTKQIELELAKQLKAKGVETGEINDKTIENILNPTTPETDVAKP